MKLTFTVYTYFTPHTKNEHSYGLMFKHNTWNCKYSRTKHREKLYDSGFGNIILNITQKTQATKVKIRKWSYFTLKLLHIKGNNRVKWEKIFINHTSDKGLIFKLYK